MRSDDAVMATTDATAFAELLVTKQLDDRHLPNAFRRAAVSIIEWITPVSGPFRADTSV